MHSLHGEGKLTFHDFLGTVTKGNGLSWLKVLFKKKKVQMERGWFQVQLSRSELERPDVLQGISHRGHTARTLRTFRNSSSCWRLLCIRAPGLNLDRNHLGAFKNSARLPPPEGEVTWALPGHLNSNTQLLENHGHGIISPWRKSSIQKPRLSVGKSAERNNGTTCRRRACSVLEPRDKQVKWGILLGC